MSHWPWPGTTPWRHFGRSPHCNCFGLGRWAPGAWETFGKTLLLVINVYVNSVRHIISNVKIHGQILFWRCMNPAVVTCFAECNSCDQQWLSLFSESKISKTCVTIRQWHTSLHYHQNVTRFYFQHRSETKFTTTQRQGCLFETWHMQNSASDTQYCHQLSKR